MMELVWRARSSAWSTPTCRPTGSPTPTSLDLLLLLVEGHVRAVAALHRPVGGLSDQLPPPLLLGDEGGVADGHEGVGDGDEGQEVLGGQTVGQLPVAQRGEVFCVIGTPGGQQQGHGTSLGHQTKTQGQFGLQQAKFIESNPVQILVQPPGVEGGQQQLANF